MLKRLSESLNKSITNFVSQSNDLDESRIPPSGTVSLPVRKVLCKSCKDKGCCAVCRKTPCTPLIKCNGKKCKNWVHFDCDILVGDKGDMVDIYYCPPCRKRFPKSRGKVTYYNALDQSNICSIVQNTVYDMIDVVSTINDAADYVAVINSNTSIDINNAENFSKLDYLFDESFDASIRSESLTSAHNTSGDSESSAPSVIFSNVDVFGGSDVNKSENNDASKENQVPSTDQVSTINKLNVKYKNVVSSTPAKNQTGGEVTDKTPVDILTEPNISVTMDDSSYRLSLSDIISNFGKELAHKVEENFHLKSRIEALETEKFQGRFIPKEKQELETQRTENLKQKNEIMSQSINIKNLEDREESALERLRLAHEEIEHLRSGLDELNHQLYLKPDHIHQQYKQMLSLKDKQIDELRESNKNLKNALTNANKEKTTLAKNIKDLSDTCINKKLLSIALDENESLHKQIELSQLKIHEAKPPGEMQLNKLKDENAYYKQLTKELETQVSNLQQKERRPVPTPKNSPKKDTQQTRIFEPSNATSNKLSNNHQKYESRGPCRYFPNCKWGDKCKWDHFTNIVKPKPRNFFSVPNTQLRPSYSNHQSYPKPYEMKSRPQQPVHFPKDVSKPPPPMYGNPNPFYYQPGNTQMINESLPYQVSATSTSQSCVNKPEFIDNRNLINVPLVSYQNSYHM